MTPSDRPQAALGALLSACAVFTASAQGTPLNVVVNAPPADAVTYQAVGADLRRCAFPRCGGDFVKAVNQSLTRCADGKRAARCHAVWLDTEALGWSDAQRLRFQAAWSRGQALVQGQLSMQRRQGIDAPVLVVHTAWQAQVLKAVPQGPFHRVQRTGIVCVTTPCPSLSVQTLNSREAPRHPELDLASSGATDTQIATTAPVLANPGIIVAGQIVSTTHPDLTGRPRPGRTLVAREFYLPAQP